MIYVSIVVLNWNGGAENCIAAVKSALDQDYPYKEILFVDNASTDGSFEAVQRAYPALLYIQTGSNLGCPGGRNVGASAATVELVLFLENDGVWASNDVVSGIVNEFTQNPSIGALYTRVEGYQSRTPDPPIDNTVDNNESKGLYLSSSFRGGASAIRRELFNKIGQFPADFVRQYEERYVSLLIYQKGYQVAYWPEKVLLHKGSDYQGKSVTVIKYNCINELKAIKRTYPSFVWPIYFALKTLLWGFRLFRNKQSDLFLEAMRMVLTDSIIVTPVGRISFKTLRKIQSIRYGKIDVQIQGKKYSNFAEIKES